MVPAWPQGSENFTDGLHAFPKHIRHLKKCTKAEKAADYQRLKVEQAAKEEATKAGITCLAMMEMEAKEKANVSTWVAILASTFQ